MFDVLDLFAGIGGFHAALSPLGGRVVQAAEIDPNAARVYEENWHLAPDGDVRWLAADAEHRVRSHAVLTAGFPCQPFSKSGYQRGMTEDRGTLFNEIVRILKAKRPPVVMLENVRNIAGPRHARTWSTVIGDLRSVGYQVSEKPLIFSPHLLSPDDGGAPQIRERVYILATYVGDSTIAELDVPLSVSNEPQNGWDPSNWSIPHHALGAEPQGVTRARFGITADEELWIDTWNEFLAVIGNDTPLPGHPLWEPVWRARRPALSGLPMWKQTFIRKNHEFYLKHREAIDHWRRRHPELSRFPMSRRKLEWQAQDGPRDLWKLLLHLRPSGIRAKKPTYAPALVAMNQASIYGPARRRLTHFEAARLQGFDETFTFGSQVPALGYKQMGNAVHVGAARYVFSRYVEDNAALIENAGPLGPGLVEAVRAGAALKRQTA